MEMCARVHPRALMHLEPLPITMGVALAMPFAKGKSGNPAGRKPGAKTSPTAKAKTAYKKEIAATFRDPEYIATAKKNGTWLTPMAFLESVMNDTKQSNSARMAAAMALLPYAHSRKPQEVTRQPNSGAGGLIMVPADASLDDWKAEAAAQQASIIEQEKQHATTH